jgi:Ca-activated chloride channel family protein
MRWENPWLLLALLLVPLAMVLGRRGTARPPAVLWVRVPKAWVGSALFLRGFELLPWVVLVLAVLAAARPQRGVSQSETESKGVDIVLVIDISPSMAAQDFLPLNRLSVAKETAREFIRQRPHDRIGLVGFAATAFTQCPLTLDHAALAELTDQLDFGLAEDGTAIGMGLATAVTGLRHSKTPSKVVILLTDGENNRGSIDPATGAELARAYGVRVHTVLVGRGGIVPVPIDDPVLGQRIAMVRMDVDETTLRDIAQRTGGRFFRATDSAALARIYAEIDRMERTTIRSIEYREYRDLGPWVLGAAAVLLLIYGLGTATWAFRLP